MRVFVKNMRGEPLMPCSSRKARVLLQQKKAKILGYKPFTIGLLVATGETTQRVDMGVDLGAKYNGIAVTSEEKVFSKGTMELRQDVSSLLETRSSLRRGRRQRNTRYRRCKFKYKTKRFYDTKKKKWVKKKITFASPRAEGWLPPSLQSRIDNTFYWIDKFLSLLPNPKLHMEVGKFDVQKMINPTIEGEEYQQGESFGYHDVRYYVFTRDNYTCQVCKKKNKIFNTHHIVYRSHGGSDSASNLITVCTDCHTHENHQQGGILWDWMIKKKKVPQYKAPPFMNSLRKRVFTKYPNARITYGSETTPKRKELELEKSHENDAISISNISIIKELPKESFRLVQFRKKKRSLHEATARKGRKEKNRDQKRNEKNTKECKGFFLNDTVLVYGNIGFLTGFTGATGAYIKTIEGEYITPPEKNYKQVSLKELICIHHNNNWQYIVK